jgi:hypothetical protein
MFAWLGIGLAMASSLTGARWAPEDMPLPVALDAATCPEGLDCDAALEAALSRWLVGECDDLAFDNTGAAGTLGGSPAPLDVMFVNDLSSDAAAVTLLQTDGALPFGLFVEQIVRAEIRLDGTVAWGDEEMVADALCEDIYSLEAVLTREIGVALGLDAGALSEVAPCEPAADVESSGLVRLAALYAPRASFSCVPESADEVVGALPLAMTCVLDAADSLNPDVAEWRFGDGGSAEGSVAQHTYETAGNHTVSVTFPAANTCVTDANQRLDRVGYVRACAAPDVAFGFNHIGGLDYRIENRTDVSVYGCVRDIWWNVYKGRTTKGRLLEGPIHTWEPSITVPEEGEYTIEVTVEAIGGVATITRGLQADGGIGDGYQRACAHVTPLSAGSLAAWLVMFASLRRRQQGTRWGTSRP